MLLGEFEALARVGASSRRRDRRSTAVRPRISPRRRRHCRAAAQAHELVLIAEHLRLARVAFDRLTGRAGVEDVLDALFGRFCLGK